MDSPAHRLSRRQTLALLGAPALQAPAWFAACAAAAPQAAQAAVPTDMIKVLYRKESEKAPIRLDPAVDAATRALEDEFLKRGYRVVQPTADALTALDKGPGMSVTFAADAGFSLLFSLSRNLRPRPGADSGIAEVRLASRVYIGANVLSTDVGVGMALVNLAPETREFAERSGMEDAARDAAKELVTTTVRRLKALDPARIEEMGRLAPIADVYQPIAVPVAPVVVPPPAPAPPVVVAPAGPVPAPVPAPPPPAVAAAQPLAAPVNKHALVVCVADYSAVRDRNKGLKIGDLRGVAIDQRRIVSSLKSIGFPDGNVKVLSDAQATSAAVRRSLDELVAKAQPDDLVIIAISAHGAPANGGPSGFGQPVLSDYEVREGDAKDNALNFWELQSRVGNMRAQRTLLVLDTCHSGAATQMMQTAEVSSSGVTVQGGNTQNPERMASVMSSGRHFAIVSASQSHEYSWESAEGGVFTKQFTQALTETRGAQPLESLFRERVIQQVQSSSKQACKCREGQTPVLAFSGQGNQIRINASPA